MSSETPNTAQLSLPYQEIKPENLANREQIRKDKEIDYGSLANYRIPFSRLRIREGYNDRTLYEGVEELADAIFAYGGLKEPMRVDAMKDGTFFIDEGHRRYFACELLHTQGRGGCVEKVDTIINSRTLTELQRKINMSVGNMHRHALIPIDQAKNAWEIKHCFGKEYSNDEVAAMLGYSRQKVDYLIMIWDASDDLKNEIRNGNMGITEAVALIRRNKKVQKDADKKEEDSHKTSAAPLKPEPDLLAGEIKELEELQNVPIPEQVEDVIDISDVIDVTPDNAADIIGRKLSLPAKTREQLDAEEETEECVFKAGEVLNENDIQVLFDSGVPVVTVYKKGEEPVAKSVITVAPETEEKGKYDEGREEIGWCQNVIGLVDKLEAITNKFDIPDGSKKDVADIVKWIQNDMANIRDWVHKNKKQNKIR